jgi:hypothetical protein
VSAYLPIATRAYAEQAKPLARKRAKRGRRGGSWRLPKRVFVFDCETEIHAGQPLSFGSYG